MYRIKEKQRWNIFKFTMGKSSEDYLKSVFYVQYKYKYIPFWITITSSFDSESQAENHIKLKLKVYSEVSK